MVVVIASGYSGSGKAQTVTGAHKEDPSLLHFLLTQQMGAGYPTAVTAAEVTAKATANILRGRVGMGKGRFATVVHTEATSNIKRSLGPPAAGRMVANNGVNPGSSRRYLILCLYASTTLGMNAPHAANLLPKVATCVEPCGDESGATRGLGYVGANGIPGDLTSSQRILSVMGRGDEEVRNTRDSELSSAVAGRLRVEGGGFANVEVVLTADGAEIESTTRMLSMWSDEQVLVFVRVFLEVWDNR